MAPCTHLCIKKIFSLEAENGLGRFSTGSEVNEAGRPILAAGRVRSEFEEKKRKKTLNPAATKTLHEIHSSPATATPSRRRATKHVPCVSPYSPASIDLGFVEIGLLQLSQSVKTTNVTHTLTDTQTDGQTDGPTD